MTNNLQKIVNKLNTEICIIKDIEDTITDYEAILRIVQKKPHLSYYLGGDEVEIKIKINQLNLKIYEINKSILETMKSSNLDRHSKKLLRIASYIYYGSGDKDKSISKDISLCIKDGDERIARQVYQNL